MSIRGNFPVTGHSRVTSAKTSAEKRPGPVQQYFFFLLPFSEFRLQIVNVIRCNGVPLCCKLLDPSRARQAMGRWANTVLSRVSCLLLGLCLLRDHTRSIKDVRGSVGCQWLMLGWRGVNRGGSFIQSSIHRPLASERRPTASCGIAAAPRLHTTILYEFSFIFHYRCQASTAFIYL